MQLNTHLENLESVFSLILKLVWLIKPNTNAKALILLEPNS